MPPTTQAGDPNHTRGASCQLGHRAFGLLTAVSMTVRRGAAAREIAALADLTERDRVVDVGCGPGTAVRQAARQAAEVTGVDPAPVMLRLGRWITALRRVPGVTFVQGAAEALPLPDGGASVVWTLSSLHHWSDRPAGLAEAYRVLAPGGRILIAERLVRPGARGLRAHGMALDQTDQLGADLRTAGFTDVRAQTRSAGRRRLVVTQASRPTADPGPTRSRHQDSRTT